MAESMTQADVEVEDFFDRICWAPETEAEIPKVVGTQHSKSEETDLFYGGHGAAQQNPEEESHRRPLSEILDDEHGGPAHTRRCIRSEGTPLVVQRPIPFTATSVSFDAGEQRYRLESHDVDWCNRILERYVDAGYGPRSNSLGEVGSIVDIFHTLPPDLADVLKEGLHALQVLRAARATSRRPQVAAVSATEGTSRFAAVEDDMWEQNDQCGYLRFEWDPVTERRRYSSTPASLAHFIPYPLLHLPIVRVQSHKHHSLLRIIPLHDSRGRSLRITTVLPIAQFQRNEQANVLRNGQDIGSREGIC
jgi:hypothetical protein